jgi:hypothetical protein
MASPCSSRVWLLCTFSHSPGLSYLCECVYDEAEWMGREKCKWESCVLCWRVALLSAAWLYTHKFSNPCVLPISLDVVAFVVISCIPFMSTLTYHHPFCVFSSHAQLWWWVGKTFLSILLKCVWVFWACRKYNQFYFAPNLIPKIFAAHFTSPFFSFFCFWAELKTSFQSLEIKEKLFHFLTILWNEIFVKLFLFGWVRSVGLNILQN